MMLRRLLAVLLLATLALLCVGSVLVVPYTRLAPAVRSWLERQTGEVIPAAQVRGLVHLMSGRLRPYPATAPDEPVRYASLPPFGVNTFLQTEVEPDKVERSLRMIHEAGFQWIRQEFPWEDIEIHHKGWFVDLRAHEIKNAWTKYDRIVGLAEANELRIIARLSTPPSWSRARGAEAGAFAPPDNLSDYCDYVKAVVGRYSGRIQHFQIWNEPNIYPEWGVYDINPEAYTDLLKTGYTCAKEANPEVVILTAPLGPTIELAPSAPTLNQRALNDFLFLQRMYDAGAKEYFDVLAVQDYGLWSGPDDRRMRPRVLNFSRPMYIRDIMIRNGDGAKPIWASEVGWNSAPEPLDAPFGRFSEEARAQFAAEGYERIRREWPWMGVVTYWFFKQSDRREAEQPQYYFRLVEPDFSPTPAYHALSEYIHQAMATPTMYRGYHQEDHWTVAYSGDWSERDDPEAVMERYRLGEPGDEMSLRFEGKSLALIARPFRSGTIEIRVDDGPPRSLTIAPGPSTLDAPAELLLAANLGPGPHTLEVRVLDGTFGLDGILIR